MARKRSSEINIENYVNGSPITPGVTYKLGDADAGTGTRHLYANGLTNPTYHALEAMAVNAIETEETADFVDINNPLEQA